jgi:NAD+ kinase
MLSVSIKKGSKTIEHTALNDCIIHSGNNGRVIKVSAKIDGNFLADYVGDGLIVSTPTGSTAYSLAASGPIVHPLLSVLLLTPICPHTLTQRPMLLSTSHTLSITADSSAVREHPVLSIDGQTSIPLGFGDVITVTKSQYPLMLIVNQKRKYLEVLRSKLGWGIRG